MQTSIPNYKRPFYLVLEAPDLTDEINIAELLFAYGFAVSKSQGKQMIKNGEVWHLPVAAYEEWAQSGKPIDIRSNMEKSFEQKTFGFNLDVLFIGGKKDAAMCHRILFK